VGGDRELGLGLVAIDPLDQAVEFQFLAGEHLNRAVERTCGSAWRS
jgi:hypothetical protein